MDHRDPLICAYRLNPAGTATELHWRDLEAGTPLAGALWVNLDRLAPATESWLLHTAGLDPLTVQALLQEETRPRAVVSEAALLVFLRGANLNPGTEPDDMVSIRLWTDGERLISLHGQTLRAVDDLRAEFRAGTGPGSAGELLTAIATRLVDRMAPVLHGLEERLNDIEAAIVEGQVQGQRSTLATLRRQAINFRRFVGPQRDVINRLVYERSPLLGDANRAELREVGERLNRLVEDLDAVRDRAQVSQEELATRLSDQMNRNMYVLSLVAALFLPLGFLTGLLGINVGGMPGTQSQTAFWIVCALLVLLGGLEALFFYLRRWL